MSPHRRRRNESGQVAVMFALLTVVLFGMAAFSVDIARQYAEDQGLQDTVDTAAHAGAYELPGNGSGAVAAALAMARANDPTIDPVADLWCIVGSTGGSAPAVKTTDIPAVCNPGPAPYTASTYPGLRCNGSICAIPCKPDRQCNAIRVADRKSVPYAFAPVIGVSEGSTGEKVATACAGGCGSTIAPNPMDVMFVADRTPSMSDSNRVEMQNAIKSTLATMTPAQQYVGLATLHKSVTSHGTCSTTATVSSDGVTAGTWIPVQFSNDYLAKTATPSLNTNSDLVKGVSCLPKSPAFNTHLASALKAAARYVLGYASNNLSTLPAREGKPKKVIIFETDGMPDEILDGGSTSLGDPGDVGAGLNTWATDGGVRACNNAIEVARQAKAAGATIITVGFGNARTAPCRKPLLFPTAPWVRDVLASMASPAPDGTASDADNRCANLDERTTENSDGDFYFCAASGNELGPIFKSAIAAIGGGVKMVRFP